VTVDRPAVRGASASSAERDNEQVTGPGDGETRSGDLPPPTGPPLSGATTGRRPSAAGARPDGDGVGRSWTAWFESLPLDDARGFAEWWFGPLVQSRTWVSLAYLFTGAVLGGVWFVAVVAMLAVSLPLVIVGIGVPLTVLSFTAVGALAGVERSRAEWVGDPIPPRPLAPVPSGGALQRLLARLGDATRWRQVAYFLCLLVAGPTLFAVAAIPWSLLVQAAGSGFGGVLLALLLAGVAGRVTVLVGRVAHSFVEWFLGTDRTAELEARVDSLAEQRQEILDAVSAERRRIERNLHDGVQQQLVALGIDIGRAAARLEDDPAAARRLLDDARDKVRASVGELRTIGRGLHPAVLDDRGLDAALSSVVAGAPIPIEVTVDVEGEVPVDVAETTYYVANEAVANVLKHSRARVASIRLTRVSHPVPALRLEVHDDGRGGATTASGGTGLAGMAARVRGGDGAFVVDSPPGGPTTVTAVVPLASAARPRVASSGSSHGRGGSRGPAAPGGLDGGGGGGG
jgi:signal transduction histidine kinase